jgi:hypothetical protein
MEYENNIRLDFSNGSEKPLQSSLPSPASAIDVYSWKVGINGSIPIRIMETNAFG